MKAKAEADGANSSRSQPGRAKLLSFEGQVQHFWFAVCVCVCIVLTFKAVETPAV